MNTCPTCSALTATNPCDRCGAGTCCSTCGVWLDGPFCRSCGTPAPNSQATPIPQGPVGQGGAAAAPQLPPTYAQDAGALFESAPTPSGEWLDAVPLVRQNDHLGQPLTWAFQSLKQNLGILSLITLVVVGIYLLAIVIFIAIQALATALGVPLLSVLATLVSLLFGFVVFSLEFMILARTWSLASRGVPISLHAVLQPQGFPSILGAMLLVAPLMIFLGPIAVGFWMTAFLLAAGDMFSAAESVGRMLSITCSSARRFFHTVLIGLFSLIWGAFLTLGAFSLFSLLSASAAVAAFGGSGGFDEYGNYSSGSFQGQQSGIVLILVIGAVLLLWAALSFALIHLVGLWIAARVRLVTGRPLGSLALSADQILEVVE